MKVAELGAAGEWRKDQKLFLSGLLSLLLLVSRWWGMAIDLLRLRMRLASLIVEKDSTLFFFLLLLVMALLLLMMFSWVLEKMVAAASEGEEEEEDGGSGGASAGAAEEATVGAIGKTMEVLEEKTSLTQLLWELHCCFFYHRSHSLALLSQPKCKIWHCGGRRRRPLMGLATDQP